MGGSVSLRSTRSIVAALAFALGAVLVSLNPGSATAGTQIVGGGAAPQVGQSFSTSVAVSLVAQDELNAFDVTLAYDPAVIAPTVVTVAAGWLQPPLEVTFGGGSVKAAAFWFPGFCTGSCPLFTVTWTAVGSGGAALQVSSATLSGRQGGAGGQLSSVTSALGAVTVSGGPQSTPTNTVAAATSTFTPTNTAVPPTQTAVPPTSTSLPATSTPAAAASTPTAVTPTATAAAPTAAAPTTPAPTTAASFNPGTGPAEGAPPSSGSPVIAPPAAGAPTVASVVANPPVPTAQGTVQAPAPARTATLGPNDQFIPLPPRTGEGLAPAESSRSQTRTVGFTLMGLGLAASVLDLLARRTRSSGVTPGVGAEVERYLAEQERRASRGD